MSTELRSSSHAETGFNATAQAVRAAAAAARRAGVTTGEAADIDALREVSALLESVWGRGPEGVPVNSEILRSLVHAGGAVTTARDGNGSLVGAAVLSVAAPVGTCYSLIAAAASGSRDRGVGHAVKLAQRAWALGSGYDRMLWTFDPLVRRNARFNLVKLGAVAAEYVPSFYGQMSDAINTADESDRLVADWVLDTRRALAATEGTAGEPEGPPEDAETLEQGPDGRPMLCRRADTLWCRVPDDIVGLRAQQPEAGRRWRVAVREALVPAFADGLVAASMTRTGWYQLIAKEDLS
jgi:predicted GNAT superfamily acetyltransferase